VYLGIVLNLIFVESQIPGAIPSMMGFRSIARHHIHKKKQLDMIFPSLEEQRNNGGFWRPTHETSTSGNEIS
jgi:hypothetical protein